jgi:hypothetical protein
MSGISPNDAMQARLRAGADKKALDAVIRYSDLRGEHALRVARHAVTAAAPELHTMYAQQMAGASANEAAVAGLMVLTAFTAEVGALVTLFRQGDRKAKALAAVGLATNTGMLVYGRLKRHRIRQAARLHLADKRVKVAGA